MRKNLSSRVALTLVFSLLLLLISCGKEQAAVDTYICPMHPTVISDRPGNCPVCGMDLVRKGNPGEEVKITAELNYLLKPTNAMVISSIKTVMPVQKQMEFVISANGVVAFDTRRITAIPIRFSGRIEKLLVKYNFQPVRKGQKILEIYSPELLNAQRDLLYLTRSDKDNAQLITAARERLKLLGASNTQIDQLISAGHESNSFTIYSPVDGYVFEDNAANSSSPSRTPEAGSSMNDAMPAQPSKGEPPVQFENSALTTREGMYVNAGQVVFKVINTDNLWVEFDVYQQDAAYLKINDPARLTLDDGSGALDVKIGFVEPFITNEGSFAKVRIYLSNSGNRYQVGQLVKASFGKSSPDAMWIPTSARLDLGQREIAFVKRRGIFRPREIVSGRQSGEWIEVAQGLEAGDSVAYNAQFMVDSEGFIKVRN